MAAPHGEARVTHAQGSATRQRQSPPPRHSAAASLRRRVPPPPRLSAAASLRRRVPPPPRLSAAASLRRRVPPPPRPSAAATPRRRSSPPPHLSAAPSPRPPASTPPRSPPPPLSPAAAPPPPGPPPRPVPPAARPAAAGQRRDRLILRQLAPQRDDLIQSQQLLDLGERHHVVSRLIHASFGEKRLNQPLNGCAGDQQAFDQTDDDLITKLLQLGDGPDRRGAAGEHVDQQRILDFPGDLFEFGLALGR